MAASKAVMVNQAIGGGHGGPGYPSEGGSQGDYGSQVGYGPQGGHGSEGFGSQGGIGSQRSSGSYAAQSGAYGGQDESYGSQGRYGQGGSWSQGGYGGGCGYSSQGGYAGQSDAGQRWEVENRVRVSRGEEGGSQASYGTRGSEGSTSTTSGRWHNRKQHRHGKHLPVGQVVEHFRGELDLRHLEQRKARNERVAAPQRYVFDATLSRSTRTGSVLFFEPPRAVLRITTPA